MKRKLKVFTRPGTTIPIRLLLVASLICAVTWLAVRLTSRPVLHSRTGVPAFKTEETSAEALLPPPKLEGIAASNNPEVTSEGQSLIQAVIAEQYGLKWQERAPAGITTGSGYLGISHDQNLNAWFDEEGVTVRPTLGAADRDKSWELGFRLKGYGYGETLNPAPPVVAREVKGNRVEYKRRNCQLAIADCQFKESKTIAAIQSRSNAVFDLQSAISNQQSAITEWYENRPEGIEQGFVIDKRPGRNDTVSRNEPLRLVIGLTGGLRARVDAERQSAVLLNERGEGVASYSKLLAVDADGKQLAARMETNATGEEIALVVEDADANYPIVVDPITATVEQRLDAGVFRQAEARFGWGVAIEGNRAAVSAWREDTNPAGFLIPDAGAVYLFSRTGSTWTLGTSPVRPNALPNDNCGWGLAISGVRTVYGCPGINNSVGAVFLYDPVNGLKQINPVVPDAGDRFGTSVAISGNFIIVGEPGDDFPNPDNGARYIFRINPDNSITLLTAGGLSAGTNSAAGTFVAIDGNTVVNGLPGAEMVGVEVLDSSGQPGATLILQASDGVDGDQFGESVAISGNTIVVGAYGDDDKGTDAGAAYVFVRGTNGMWTEQQKLTTNDGKPGDLFSSHAVAIEGNTIIVGAQAQDCGCIPPQPDDNRGAVFVFTRSGTVWTQQARISPSGTQGGAAANNFGISVDISGDTVIAGARTAAANDGTARAGAAYVYRLDCVAPFNIDASATTALGDVFRGSRTLCPGMSALIWRVGSYSGSTSTATFQWRKDGQAIPGATGGTYTINNLSASDAGTYDVVVTNACGSGISNPIVISLHTFSLNLTSQNFGAAGSNGSVNVIATGSCSWTAVSHVTWVRVTGFNATGDGTVSFTVDANTGATQRMGALTIAGQTFTVTQDGTAPTNLVLLSSPTFNVSEGSGSVQVTVVRTNPAGAATVDYRTSDTAGLNNCNLVNGIASARCDYTIAVGTVRFAAGESAKNISIPIIDDSYADGTENFTVTLSNASGATLGSPTAATITITDNEAANGANPVDGTAFFVRQQYLDFLNREPDPGGFAAWQGVINGCAPGNTTCDRLHVSSSFFRSPEFQDRGYFVYRFYPVSFGRKPEYVEFVPDLAKVSGFLSDAELEAAKVAFIAEFMSRPAFVTNFNGLSNTAYVDTLLTTAGITHIARDFWIAALTNGTRTRAQVLREIAESTEVYNRYYNQAFVVMQYFGYLRRDPDAFYLDWIVVLNGNPNDFRGMVNGFMNSSEYRFRFGP